MGFDVIDLNFACPVRKVISRRRGGHMMRQPTRSLEIIRSVLAAVPDKPVTVKLDRAYLESDLTYDDFWTIARGAFDAGAAALCVHARSVEQKYMGQADWAFLSAVRQSFPDRTIIGSGDVHSAADALRMIQETGVDGVTAARGAIGNPWLFLQARQLADGAEPMCRTLAQQRELLARHFDLAVQIYGKLRGPNLMRKFGIKYARMHATPAKVRAAFVNIKSAAQWQAVLDEFYA